jgi:type VI secretion system protein ImpJ
MSSEYIHWHEGLFLLPHHFQTLHREVLDRFSSERGLSWAFPYGVVEARLAPDELSHYRVRFERLTAVMPDGTLVSYPENADLSPLGIREALLSSSSSFTIYLGVPKWQAERANTFDPDEDGDHKESRIKIRFKTAREIPELPDENTGLNRKAIQFRRLNAMLLLDRDDEDMDCIPLLRVMHDVHREVSVPRQDPDYVYPCLHLGASPVLREMVRELTSRAGTVRDQLAAVLSRGSEATSVSRLELEQVLRLRSLNRFMATVPALLDVDSGAAKVPPFDVYIQLRGLLGELMALFPEREPFALEAYDHDDPFPCFNAVIRKIRNYLQGAIGPEYWKVDFQPGGPAGSLVAGLDDRHLRDPLAFYLGIYSDLDVGTLVALVQDPKRFRLLPPVLLDVGVSGIHLVHDPRPPMEFPAERGLNYFRLVPERGEQSKRAWGSLEDDPTPELAIQWTTEEGIDPGDLRAGLFMTLGEST